MTYPRVVIERRNIDGKWTDILDKEATEQRKNLEIVREEELQQTLAEADKIENEYFRLRAKAIVALAWIFGKRRIELSLLEMKDISKDTENLNITFTIAKKRKKGFFQFLKHLQKQGDPSLLNKTHPELKEEWEQWVKTEEGYRFKKIKKPKATPLSDQYAKLITEYYDFMMLNYPESKYLFPSGRSVFGSYIVIPDKPLGGRQFYSIVASLNPDLWPHLLRKTKGSQVARKYGRTLESVFMVKSTLDLTREEIAYKYIEEYVPKIKTREQDYE